MTPVAVLDTPFEERLAEALHARGLSFASVMEAVREAAEAAAPVTLTEAEARFAREGGVPASALAPGSASSIAETALRGALDGTAQGERLTTNAVASLLGRDPANVRRMLKNGDLFAAGQRDRQTAYPAWQFTDHGVLPHLRQVIAAFPAGYHARDIEIVMTHPLAELNGRTPREWLENDGAASTLVSLLDELALS